MPNQNYIKGRRKEYKVMDYYKERGFLTIRSAGSHSPVDIVAINIVTKQIKLIQCKPDSMNAHQKQKLRNENKELNNTFDVSFSVV